MMNYFFLAVIGLVSLGAFNNREWFERLAFIPFLVNIQNQKDRFLTHAFVHANWSHLLLNMFVLYIFGKNVESYFQVWFPSLDKVLYAGLFLGGVVASSIPAYVKHKDNDQYISIGASGGVSSVLFAFILIAPLQSVYIFFIPIPIKAFIFGIAYLAYEYYMDKRGGDRIAHDAHFWGAIFGLLYMTVVDKDILTGAITEISNYLLGWFS